jgi:putative transposase
VRTVAAQTGISKSSVARYFQLFGLQPHRSEGFKLSNDPFFIEKLRGMLGLHAVVSRVSAQRGVIVCR